MHLLDWHWKTKQTKNSFKYFTQSITKLFLKTQIYNQIWWKKEIELKPYKYVNKHILLFFKIKSFGAEKKTRALTFSRFKSFPWTLTRLGSTLWPLGLLGSNPNSMPATWGNRPSSLGYADTPFSKACSSCWPVV